MNTPILISSKSDLLQCLLPANTPERGTFVGLTFIIVTRGRATIEIDRCPYTAKSGRMLTLLPSHLLHTTAQSVHFECKTLAFTFDSMSDFPYMVQASVSQKMERTPMIELIKEEFKRLRSWHKIISDHYKLETHPSYKEILRALLFVFTAEISNIYSNKPIKSSVTYLEELTDAFFGHLHEHVATHREVLFYTDKLCVSARYLEKVLVRVTGHTPTYWIADFTIRQAKIQLKSTTLTVTELSEKLHFANSSFFARYFKRHTGYSPSEYRLAEQ